MRGEVLKPDDAEGPGLILGVDGQRYWFTTPRVHKRSALPPGTPVDFIALSEEARDIYVIEAPAPEPAAPPQPEPAIAGAPGRRDSLFKYFLRAISKNYFNFNGRARRAEYWGFVLFQINTLFLLLIPDSIVTYLAYGTTDPEQIEFLPVFTALFYVYCLIPGIAIAVRRLHDSGLSGWLYLVNIIPYIGGIILFVLMCLDSRRETNKHGPSPKYAGQTQVDTFT